MKRLLALLVVFCAIFSLTACGGEKRTIYVLESLYYDGKNGTGFSGYTAENNTYNRNGAMTGHTTMTPDGLTREWTVETDEYGRLISQTWSDKQGNSNTWKYTYDIWGNVATLSKYIGKYRQNYEVNTYDSQGNLLTREFWIGEDMSKTIYTYDNGRLEKQVTYRGDQETEKILYRYDEAGRLATATIFGGFSVLSIREYSYSEDGLTTYIKDSFSDTTTEELRDAHGNLLRTTVYNETGEVISKCVYTYRAVEIPAEWPRKN